jgi:hypothetical protein
VRRIVAISLLSLLITADVALAQPAPTTGPFTVSAEALLWWFKGNATPPLITEAPTSTTDGKTLLGDRDYDTNPNPGFRLTVGYAFNDRWGLDSSVFYVPTRTTSHRVSSSGEFGSTDLLLPVIDATTGEEDPQLISFGGVYAGSARVQISNSLLGSDLNATFRLASGPGWRVDALGGFRYLRLRESFEFTTESPFIPPFPRDIYQTTDRLDATNNFFGGQLGVRARMDRGAWFGTAVAKVGLGVMRQTVNIEGTLFTNDFVFPAPTPVAYPGGGYFATPTNIGERSRSVFSVVPEVGLNIGYRLTSWMSIVSGYTFLYASDVVRAPKQINRTVNYSDVNAPPAVPAGPQEPSFRFKSSDFWAQGLSVGLEFRY